MTTAIYTWPNFKVSTFTVGVEPVKPRKKLSVKAAAAAYRKAKRAATAAEVAAATARQKQRNAEQATAQAEEQERKTRVALKEAQADLLRSAE